MTDFTEWLNQMIKARGLKNQAELAKLADIDTGYMSRILSGERVPGYKTSQAIARVLRVAEEDVLYAAGKRKRKPKHGNDEDLEELKYLFLNMTEEEQEEFLASGRLKITLREQREHQREKSEPRLAHG